jgi:DNA-binding FadR family transcriptional regulator
MEKFSDFILYLIKHGKTSAEGQIPSLTNLSQLLGVNVAKLREQLEVARVLGLVEVKPRTGIKRQPYKFTPAVYHSVSFAVSTDPELFYKFADFRKHIESAYWYDAVSLLTSEDGSKMRDLVISAENKLKKKPIQIPNLEHRELHLYIYRRLDNPFITGILETYWDIYRSVGLDLYTDLSYLERVWNYHNLIVDSICQKDFEKGHHLMIEHMGLLDSRSQRDQFQLFE